MFSRFSTVYAVPDKLMQILKDFFIPRLATNFYSHPSYKNFKTAVLSYFIEFIILSGFMYNVLFLALLSAITWPGAILGLANIIDNPWSVCCRRSAQVGKQLAEVLLAREQGQRPVTLVGFSIGARVIYYCLRVRSLLKHVCTHCMLCFNSLTCKFMNQSCFSVLF